MNKAGRNYVQEDPSNAIKGLGMDEYIPVGHGKLTRKCDNEPNGDAASDTFKDELPSQPPPWPGDAKSLLAIFLPTVEAENLAPRKSGAI
jgi:hypothetical protein